MATTLGTLLAGRVRYEQPARGHRTGIEPVLLAAAVPAGPGERVLEGGTGAGAALVCLAARVPGVIAHGIEQDAELAAVAARNVACWPGLQVHVGDVMDGLAEAGFDHACANPPWHDPGGTPSPDAARRAARRAEPDGWRRWCRSLARQVRHGGTVTLILPAQRAALATAELARAGAGGALTRPLAPKLGRPAKLALVQARVGVAEAGRTLDGLVLHEADGRYTAAAEAVLRDAQPIGWT